MLHTLSRPIVSIFCIAILAASNALAAPIPATSSSAFLQAHLGLFRSDVGFVIHASGTGWIHSLPPKDNKYIATLYRAPEKVNGVQAALTVRVDKLESDITLKNYVKKWMKDYPRFGFNVLAAQKVKVGENVGYLLDVLVKSSQRQLRQVVMLKDKRAVILTCRDSQENFLNSLKACNSIINNFRWVGAGVTGKNEYFRVQGMQGNRGNKAAGQSSQPNPINS